MSSLPTSNASLIHRLPLELFTPIIHQCVRHHYADAKLAYLVELATVSVAWKTAIDGTPSLWSRISSEDDREDAEKALVNSQNHPLDIVHNPRWMNPQSPLGLITLVLPHIARWRSFDCYLDGIDCLVPLQGLAAPALEYLRVEVGNPVEEHLALFDGIPGRLQELHLGTVHLPWHHEELVGLRRLSLKCMGDAALSPSDLFEVLSNNPDLTFVSITDLLEQPLQVPSRPLYMPRLGELTMQELSHQTLQQILPSLSIPHCHYLRVSLPVLGTLRPTIAATFQKLVQHISSSTWSLHQGELELSMLGYSEFICEVQMNRPLPGQYTILLKIPESLGDVGFLIPYLPRDQIKAICGIFKDVGAWTILKPFQDLDSVTRLEISEYNNGEPQPGGFARYLGTPGIAVVGEDEEAEAVWRWPFSSLEVLCFDEYDDEDEILMALRHRCGASVKQAWEGYQLPKPLKWIYMPGMDEGVCEEIKELLGPDGRVIGPGECA